MSHEATNWRERNRWLWVKTDGHCAYCGVQFVSLADMTDDHIVPRSRGGSNSRENRVPCCMPCNATKGARSLGYLRDVLQRHAHGRPVFTAEQLAYLENQGFVFPKEPRFNFYWEALGHTFGEADHG